MPAYAPTPVDLRAIAGRYQSAEADAAYVVTVEPEGLRLTVAERPDANVRLKPAYRDAFTFPGGVVRLVRGPRGQVTALRLSNSRVWSLLARRVTPPRSARTPRG